MHQIIDGISQATPAPPLELDLTYQAAADALRRALRVYNKATSRPRKAECWAYVECQLWNARQDAVHAGVIARGTGSYSFVSDRLVDSGHRLESIRNGLTTA